MAGAGTATKRDTLKGLAYVGYWGGLFTHSVGTGSSQAGVIQIIQSKASLAEKELNSRHCREGTERHPLVWLYDLIVGQLRSA